MGWFDELDPPYYVHNLLEVDYDTGYHLAGGALRGASCCSGPRRIVPTQLEEPAMQLIDLSQEIYDGQNSHFRVTVRDFLTYADTAPRQQPPAEGYAAKLLMFADHTSTHVDAPAHFWPQRRTIDQLPLDAFWGEAIVVDAAQFAGEARPLDLPTFQHALTTDGHEVRQGDIVLVQLMRDSQDIFCGFDAELSQYLVDQGVKLVGVDRGTPDCAHLKDKPAHVILLRNDVLIVEGLRNLEQLKGRRFTFMGLPLKIRGGTGSPIRAVALVE
jgi:arylformamidase